MLRPAGKERAHAFSRSTRQMKCVVWVILYKIPQQLTRRRLQEWQGWCWKLKRKKMEVGKTRHMISSACTKRKNTQFENTPATIVQNEVSEYLSREKRSQCVAAFCRVKKSKLLSNFVLKTRKNYKFRNVAWN